MQNFKQSKARVTQNSLDIFREICNIGAGNATTALAQLLQRRIDMAVPNASLVPFEHITDIIGGPENLVAGLLVNMGGDLRGYMLLVLDTADVFELLSLLTDVKHAERDLFALGDMELSALTEVSNILVGSYLSAISAMTGLNIRASVPDLARDMAGAIMSVPATEYGKFGDDVLLLETAFFDNDKRVGGHFFLIPDLDSYQIMMKSLGMEEL